ncbi:hypothetical protein RN001_012033 [Aquatica leii]|uniref:Protein kinase domain-containing protein n=1 Tax=Aquatica leii TaxID=1421715 RepID=A0AAN7S7M0_9COLE|nr:hypothetical protein RN001_012033 [Aquatica leii]
MDTFSTPIRNRNPLKRHRSPVSIPPSPFLKKLGYGTGVAVYKLERSPHENKLRSPWAIKKLLKRNISNTVYKQRLQEEADILRKLNHPYIVGFRAVIKTPTNETCLAMEECDKSLGDLNEERNEKGLLAYPAQNIMQVALHVAEALNYLHTQVFLLHCDVKSYNILVKGNFDVCKLCDFGVTLPINSNNEVDYEKTGKDVEYVGTRLWSAPEILQYPPKITTKADIYSYGLVLWEMLALRPPCIDTMSDDDISVDELDRSACAFGKRPDLPDQDFDTSYKYVLEMFHCCTEEDPSDRPSALDLTISIPEMIKELDF